MRGACRRTAATLVWIAWAAGACLAEEAAARDQGLAARDAREGEQTTSSSEPAAEDKVGKELHALRIGTTSPPIRIDGRMDDEVWNRAAAISDFVQEDPDNMAPATEQMTIRVAYDDRYLYVAVEMLMRDPALIRDGLGRRGSAPPSDKTETPSHGADLNLRVSVPPWLVSQTYEPGGLTRVNQSCSTCRARRRGCTLPGPRLLLSCS
jgi:hypothetical protein